MGLPAMNKCSYCGKSHDGGETVCPNSFHEKMERMNWGTSKFEPIKEEAPLVYPQWDHSQFKKIRRYQNNLSDSVYRENSYNLEVTGDSFWNVKAYHEFLMENHKENTPFKEYKKSQLYKDALEFIKKYAPVFQTYSYEETPCQ